MIVGEPVNEVTVEAETVGVGPMDSGDCGDVVVVTEEPIRDGCKSDLEAFP